MRAFKCELDRVKGITEQTANESAVREAFHLLLHPRDAIISFGDERACLAEQPKNKLAELYHCYAEHSGRQS